MFDAFKVQLSVGDDIAFIGPRGRELIKGKVVAFTPKMIKCLYEHEEYDWMTQTKSMKDRVVDRFPECVTKLGCSLPPEKV